MAIPLDNVRCGSDRAWLPVRHGHGDWLCLFTMDIGIGIARLPLTWRLGLPICHVHGDWDCPFAMDMSIEIFPFARDIAISMILLRILCPIIQKSNREAKEMDGAFSESFWGIFIVITLIRLVIIFLDIKVRDGIINSTGKRRFLG